MFTRLTILFAVLPTLAVADPVLIPGFDECAELQLERSAPLGECVRGAMVTCVDWPAGEPAGIACFIAAKDEWGDLLGQRLQNVRETADERIGKIAEVETRYELERSLRQCDRHMELLLIDVPQDDRSDYIRAQCEATAVAATLATLILRTRQSAE